MQRQYDKFNGAMLSVAGDSEALVVTSSILRLVGPTRFFEGTHRGRMCVRAFIGVSARSCI